MFIRRIGEIWEHLSIRIKFLVSFFCMLALVSLFNLYLNNNNYAITDQFNDTMKDYYGINRMQLLVEDNYTALDSFLKTLDQGEKNKYQRTRNEIQSMIEPFYEEFNSLDIYFYIKAIDNSTAMYFDYFEKAISDREQGVDDYYVSFYEGRDIQQYTSKYIQTLLNLSLNEGTKLYSQVVREAEVMRSISIITIAAMFLFTMLIVMLLTNKLVNPIKKLAQSSMLMAQGDLDIEPLSIRSKDEIGVLADSFSIMSTNIRKYVQDLKQKAEIEKKLHEEELKIFRMEQLVKEARFEALQSQINPHFLFNTLNTISRTAMFENADKTVKLTRTLSNLFRYRLRQKNAIVPMEEELHIIGEYIYLQKVRFGDRLKYIECVTDECKQVFIPIFLFQPLVENAIIHGIEPKVEGGKIRIKAMTRVDGAGEEVVLVRITNTGIGMSREQLTRVRSFDVSAENSIGIANVYHRLRIAGGGSSQLTIRSRASGGTSIEIRFAKESFKDAYL
ncbi:MAG: histidine kinase [Clostridiaceae bacterium]|nr:histidine kinase [Clostridiaceae bacterium]